MIELGGNISLSGFNQMDRDTIIIVKKIVGSYVKTLSEKNKNFKSLSLTLKTVHERENSEKYEMKGNLIADKQYNAEITDYNLMIAIDKTLKKLEKSSEK